MDVTGCMLNEVPKTLWWKIGGTAMLLLNYLPNKTIGGEMRYERVFGKHDLSFMWTVGTCPDGSHQAHLPLSPRHT